MLKPTVNELNKANQSIKDYVDYLETNIAKLEDKVSLFKTELLKRDEKIAYLLDQLKLKNHKIFGSSSEKTATICAELPIFNEPEAIYNELTEEEKKPVPSIRRKRPAGHKAEVLKELPREIEEVKLSEDEQICSCCGNKMHEMGYDEHEELIPIKDFKVRTIREYKYACRNCEQTMETVCIVKARGTKAIIPKSYASAELLSHIINQKYFNATPLYRQERDFTLNGLELSRQTMSNWIIYVYEKYLKNVYDYMHEIFLNQEIIQADETTVQVLREESRKAQKKSYMWVYRTCGKAPAIVLFDYQPTRDGNNALEFLRNFKGSYLQSDGFAGYEKVIKEWEKEYEAETRSKKIKLMGCWAHTRRYFTNAFELLPLSEQNNENNLAVAGLKYINELYRIYELDEEWALRLEKLKSHLETMKEWMNKKEVLSQTHSGRAVQYLRKQWEKLITFLDNPDISLDNNGAERAIRLFVIGRKNWIFAVTPNGAKASAVIYSIVETAQANHLNPVKYLEYLFKTLPNIDLQDKNSLQLLMPWNEQIQERFASNDIKGI